MPTVRIFFGSPVTGDLDLTPDPIAVLISIPSPSITFDQDLTPSPVTLPIVLPSPTLSIDKILEPDPVDIPIVLPAPSIAVHSARAYRNIQREINPDTDYPGATPNVILEVHGMTDDPGNPLEAFLYNVTDDAMVPGSSISSSATALTRLRSGAFGFITGTKVYEVRFGGLAGGEFTLEDAVLIVDLS